MKKALLVVLSLMLLAGVAFAKGLEIKKKAGDMNVEINMPKSPPSEGKNDITVAITDSSGKQVTDAKVKIDYTMPAMSGMPAMNYKAEAKADSGSYKAVLDLSMKGPWNVVVKVSKGGKTYSIKFNIDAQ